jgi:type VI secretion system protein ImpJ
MDTPQRVAWYEGLLMGPHHLQAQDRFFDHLLHTRLSAVNHDPWGVIDFSFDHRAVQKGQLVLERFQGIMPDGLPLQFGSGAAGLPEARPFEEQFSALEAKLDVYLAVARTREGSPNLADHRDPRQRWFRSPALTHDVCGEAEAVEIDYAMPGLFLLVGKESREGYDCLKLAEVVRDDAGQFALGDNYIPPCLCISASGFLISSLRKLLAVMGTRRLSLVSSQHERGEAALEYNATDVTRFLLLNAVNTHLPVIDHFVQTGDLGLRALYLFLLQFLGQLSAFSSDFDPEQIPQFNYTDLRSTFGPLLEAIFGLLRATAQENFLSLPLQSREDGMHFGQLDDDAFVRCSQYVLGVRSTVEEAQVRSQLPRLCKLASWQDVNSILNAGTPGAPLEMTYRPPPQIPLKPGVVHFTVSTDNRYWRNVILERKLALYLPAPFSPGETTVELLAVLEEAVRGSSPGVP